MSNSIPTISIIIPVYNQTNIIGACLASIFNQTHSDFEVILINDGSTDDLDQVLKGYQDRIKVINQENKGAQVARNLGFKKSNGKYIIFCDADIIMKSDMLEKMLETLKAQDKSVGYVYSSFKFGWKKFKLWPFDEARLKKMPYIHTTSLMRRECFPGFDETLNKFQDWDLWLTILENNYRGKWINEVLFEIKSGGTMSKWLPKYFYIIKWLKSVKQYKEAREIIKQKHNL